ncbi:hypothetical protein MHM95_02050 [Pseudoalteromonas sp. CnMc7-15]|uniref:hypothetical protein n=1 Tax=unclassified Pseudoalteromonas TaxID=194690 RepID=UPI001EF3D8A8|nr:hypothetical protein [Pseudoalteromonas sp. CnMc7-15]MCG7565079.1 hypothetical protein [Pseudoalteromonas sp. CnMc7-15]
MTESAVASILVSILLFLLSMSAIIYGWGEAYLNGRRLASRAEASVLKNNFLSQLNKIENDAVNFWTFDSLSAPSKDICLISSQKFIARIQTLRNLSNQLSVYGINLAVDAEFRALRKQITLDMERASSVASPEQMVKVSEIISSAEELRGKVHISYTEIYKFVAPE